MELGAKEYGLAANELAWSKASSKASHCIHTAYYTQGIDNGVMILKLEYLAVML